MPVTWPTCRYLRSSPWSWHPSVNSLVVAYLGVRDLWSVYFTSLTLPQVIWSQSRLLIKNLFLKIFYLFNFQVNFQHLKPSFWNNSYLKFCPFSYYSICRPTEFLSTNLLSYLFEILSTWLNYSYFPMSEYILNYQNSCTVVCKIVHKGYFLRFWRNYP